MKLRWLIWDQETWVWRFKKDYGRHLRLKRDSWYGNRLWSKGCQSGSARKFKRMGNALIISAIKKAMLMQRTIPIRVVFFMSTACPMMKDSDMEVGGECQPGLGWRRVCVFILHSWRRAQWHVSELPADDHNKSHEALRRPPLQP